METPTDAPQEPRPTRAQRLRERAATAGAWLRRHPWRSAAVLPVLTLVYVLALIPLTPSIHDLQRFRAEVPAVLLSSDGVILAEYRRVNRRWVPLDRIAPSVVDALVATEDRRFYQHHGIDVVRTAGALVRTLGGDRQGGSTITQQLARNLYPEEIGRAPTLNRKLKEAITALKIESAYSKKEILETYLNTVPFLYNAYGIEMAARTYFDTTADKLDVLQAATLIGMLKGMSAYNPVLNPERARARRNLVLAQLAKAGKLDAARVESLSRRPLKVDFEKQEEPLGLAPHVAQLVRRWLIEWADRRGYDMYGDGLVIRTSIDSKLQRAANGAVTRQLAQLQPLADRARHKGEAQNPLQAGFMAMDPRSGYVRAWVGSRDFAQDQFDHVVQAKRQPGSTFKPFVYAAAFLQGMRPDTTFVDQAVSYRLPGGEVWTPTDNSPPTGQPMTLRQAVARSKNTITAQVMDKVGPAKVANLARAMGVRQSKLEPVPSLALGTSPVTLREMVLAYGAIANAGRYVEPQLVLRIERKGGAILEEFRPAEPEQALPRATALTLVDVLRAPIDEGTAVAIRQRYGITADVAGKTGTTQGNTDGWFMLMHRQLVAGAWVGFNDSTPMGSWGEGARSALPIVGDVFSQAFRYRWLDSAAEFDIPRPRPKPRRSEDPVGDFVQDLFSRIFKALQ